MPGTLFVVATPIGNLEDITLRALRVLREVAVIAAEDTRRTGHLLARHAIATPTTSLHEHNERQKTAAILKRLETGEDIALVSDAGTPTVSDPGESLVRAALAAGIRVEPVPGPSAGIAALSASGFPSEAVLFLGFPPTRSKDRKRWFERARVADATVVFFESPHRIRQTLEELRQTIGDREILVARELTKIHENLVKQPISTIIESLDGPIGEFTIVVNIGHSTEYDQRTSQAELNGRRQALAIVAKEYGLTANQLYKAIQAAKNRSNDQ